MNPLFNLFAPACVLDATLDLGTELFNKGVQAERKVNLNCSVLDRGGNL